MSLDDGFSNATKAARDEMRAMDTLAKLIKKCEEAQGTKVTKKATAPSPAQAWALIGQINEMVEYAVSARGAWIQEALGRAPSVQQLLDVYTPFYEEKVHAEIDVEEAEERARNQYGKEREITQRELEEKRSIMYAKRSALSTIRDRLGNIADCDE